MAQLKFNQDDTLTIERLDLMDLSSIIDGLGFVEVEPNRPEKFDKEIAEELFAAYIDELSGEEWGPDDTFTLENLTLAQYRVIYYGLMLLVRSSFPPGLRAHAVSLWENITKGFDVNTDLNGEAK